MLVTLVFLALFACLTVAIAASADMNMVMARNRIDVRQAGAMAETGLQLVQRHLGGLKVPGTHDAADLHHAIAECLEAAWSASGMLNAGAITWDADEVTIPTIDVTRADNRSGQISLRIEASGGALDDTTVTVHSTGRFGKASQAVNYNMTVQRGRTVLMDYGIASRSKIEMVGNAKVSGANNDAEGSMLSATYSTDQAIKLTGNIDISGDVGVCNPAGYISKTGNITIKGNEIIGAPEPEWPQVDVSVFEPYATNLQASGSSGNTTLSNIRIPPNTNPTFTGNTVLIGCVVCEPPTIDNLTANQVQFMGNLSSAGVECLPPAAHYDGLRSLTGSFLLAPGYSAQFAGNFNTVNGCMVASEFQFTGNSGGTVKGGVVNLRDSQFKISGNAHIKVDKENAVQNPAGLDAGFELVCVSGSYSE